MILMGTSLIGYAIRMRLSNKREVLGVSSATQKLSTNGDLDNFIP